jgi:arylsulfatase A-like enzyme
MSFNMKYTSSLARLVVIWKNLSDLSPKALTIAMLFTVAACTADRDEVRSPSQPNIVFIIADDLGWTDVEFHEGNVPTPNLNRLRSEGMELKQHYVAPVCSPTRAGFLTGRYWSRFGITTPINTRGLPFDTVTLPRLIRDAGYNTAIVGKWHLGSKPEWGPNHFGFDHSYGSLAGGVTPWSHYYKKGPYSETWHRNGELITEEGYVTDLLVKEAVEWIEKQPDDEPFFLYAPFTAIHLPIREPKEWLDRVPKEIVGEVPRHYAACIMHLDDAVGRIVSAVDKSGRGDNTLIVFTSDNGGSTAENNDTKYPNINDDCPDGPLTGNNLPLRGQKGELYEGGTRVPTLVRWPGTIEAGSTAETPVHIVDWMPTFSALSGYNTDFAKLKWDGVNIGPVLKGEGGLPERALYSAGTRFRSEALREGDWKLIRFNLDKEDETRVELYNIASDPNEKVNLAASQPERLAQLQAKLIAAAAKDNDSVVPISED